MKKYSQIYIDMNTGQWVAGESDTISSIESIVATQSSDSLVWMIPHNKGTDKVIVQVTSNDENVLPDEIEIVDDNNITVTFATPTSGSVNILFF